MYCPECGSQTLDKAKYCIECGHKIPGKMDNCKIEDNIRRHMLESQEAADYLHISYWTILEKAKKGLIPCVRVGRRVLFSQEGLDAWIAEQELKSVHNEETLEYGKLRKIKDRQ